MMDRARTIFPPNATPIDWWPKHTPNRGVPLPAHSFTTSIEMPASCGSPGPGEITTPSGSRAMSFAALIASLRITSTSAPSSERYWTRL
jgi:hypothetical protein